MIKLLIWKILNEPIQSYHFIGNKLTVDNHAQTVKVLLPLVLQLGADISIQERDHFHVNKTQMLAGSLIKTICIHRDALNC